MKKKSLGILLIHVFFILPSGAYGQAVQEEPTEVIRPAPDFKPNRGERPDLGTVTQSIIERTNDFRKVQDRSEVTINASLTKAARYYAEFMAKEDKFGHSADDQHPADRAKKHGYNYCLVLENIAYQFNLAGFKSDKLAKEFVEGWQHSPGHRKNMLDPDVSDTGVAVAYSEKSGHYYAVQMFGRPKSKAIEFSLSNQVNAAVEYRIGDQSYSLQPRYTRTDQLCRPADLSVQTSEASKEPQVLRPENGNRLVIVNNKGQYEIKKE
jgi:uncharacterized protein YkwD